MRSEFFGNSGDQSSLPEQQEANAETLESVELGWGEAAHTNDVDGVVGGERLGFREEQVQGARKKGMEEEQRVLTALALLGEVISDQCQQKLKGNPDVGRITGSRSFKN